MTIDSMDETCDACKYHYRIAPTKLKCCHPRFIKDHSAGRGDLWVTTETLIAMGDGGCRYFALCSDKDEALCSIAQTTGILAALQPDYPPDGPVAAEIDTVIDALARLKVEMVNDCR